MKIFEKIWQIFEAVLLSVLTLCIQVALSVIFIISYKIITEVDLVGGIICYGIWLFFFTVFGLGGTIILIDYLKAAFKKCSNCNSRRHFNTSLGGSHNRFTCITCGESRWEDYKN